MTAAHLPGLRQAGADLNLADSDDRAVFRQRVDHLYRHATLPAIHDAIAELGLPDRPTSRVAALRTLADGVIGALADSTAAPSLADNVMSMPVELRGERVHAGCLTDDEQSQTVFFLNRARMAGRRCSRCDCEFVLRPQPAADDNNNADAVRDGASPPAP